MQCYNALQIAVNHQENSFKVSKMHIKTESRLSIKHNHPKTYLITIIGEKHIPWEFSMKILMNIFHKTLQEATAIADEIQNYGEGICGAYLYEIAETKALNVETQANKAGLSLQCLLEEV